MHDAATFYVAAELSLQNLKTEQLSDGTGADLVVTRPGGATVLVRVKGKTSPVWQAPFDMPRLKGHAVRLVVFVDLDPRIAPTPAYWIAPQRWVLGEITRRHRAYFRRSGGERPRSPESKHSTIADDQLVRWRDRWGLFTES